MIEKNKILLADCMDIMAQMPDKFVDLALVDPPYGIGENKGQYESRNINRIDKRSGKPIIINHKGYNKKEWDNAIPSKKYFEELFRISKNQIIFGGNYFIEHLKNTSCFIIWDKCNGDSDFADCEIAWTSFKTAIRQIKFMWSGFCQGKSITEGNINQGNKKLCDKRIHPTQKPLAIGRWCLQQYAKKGDLIFDSHSGSGTFAIAAYLEGHDFIACEKDADYHKDSVKRLEEIQVQGRLFEQVPTDTETHKEIEIF